MSEREELRDLAVKLSGVSWWDTLPPLWTKEQQAAHARAPIAEQRTYGEDVLQRIVDMEYWEDGNIKRISYQGQTLAEYPEVLDVSEFDDG